MKIFLYVYTYTHPSSYTYMHTSMLIHADIGFMGFAGSPERSGPPEWPGLLVRVVCTGLAGSIRMSAMLAGSAGFAGFAGLRGVRGSGFADFAGVRELCGLRKVRGVASPPKKGTILSGLRIMEVEHLHVYTCVDGRHRENMRKQCCDSMKDLRRDDRSIEVADFHAHTCVDDVDDVGVVDVDDVGDVGDAGDVCRRRVW